MSSVDLQLATDLARLANIRRAVETGTYKAKTARKLSAIFPTVVTIELDVALHAAAVQTLSDLPGVTARQGHSVAVLSDVAGDGAEPTFYFLDGHWSGGVTSGAEDECPVIEELAAIGTGHPDDCIVIDDAHMFTSAPAPPMDPAKWPTLLEVFDALRGYRPDHFITLLAGQVVSVPQSARPAVDAYGQRARQDELSLVERAVGAAFQVRERVRR